MLCFFVIFGFSAVTYAYTGTVMTISGSGNVTKAKVATYPFSTFTKIIIKGDITGIEDGAFQGCTSLTTIELPDALLYLGGAFTSTRLQKLSLPKNVKYVNTFYLIYSCMTITEFIVDPSNTNFKAYDGCLYSNNLSYLYSVPTGKTSINFSPELTEIGQWAFSKMTLSISMPDKLAILHNSVFIDCTINKIDFTENSNLASISKSCFHQTFFHCPFVMPPKVESLKETAFWQTSIETFTYKGTSKLVKIESQAFLNSKFLTSVTLPASVQSIDDSAFQGCPLISTFNIPTTQYFISENGYVFNAGKTQLVFASPSLETLNIPSTVTKVCISTLQRCTKVNTINMNGNQNLIEKDKVFYTDSRTKAAYALGSASDVTILDTATSIAESLFQGIQSLTSCSFGSSTIKTIGDYTFYNCTNLKSITLPPNLVTTGSYCFRYSGITSISLPETYQFMNFYFCSDCQSLQTVYIHPNAHLENITSKSFHGCNLLTSVTFNNKLKNIQAESFVRCAISSLTFPSSLKQISHSAFESNTPLKSISFNDNLQTIDQNAFYGCSSLTSVTLPSGLSSLGAFAFCLCTGLTSVSFNNNQNLKTLGGLIFQSCTSLTTFEVPAGVTTFEPTAFYKCSNLKSFTSKSQTYQAEDGILYKGTVLAVCPCAARNVSVRSGTTEIGANAFYGGSGVTMVDFGESSRVQKIGVQTFYECTALASLYIPPSVQTIESGAFSGCINLSSIQFGANSLLESIGASTFSGCEILGEVIFNGECNLTNIGESTFQDCKMLSKIVIPSRVSTIGGSAFKGCTQLSECLLVNLCSLSEIRASCFEGCSALETVTLPENLTSIESKSFYGCSSLKAVILPPKLKNIGMMAFYGSAVEVASIPINVENIEEMAFANNNRLTTIYYCGKRSFSKTIFYNCPNIQNVYLMVEYPEVTFCGLQIQRVMGTCMELPSDKFTIDEHNRSDSMMSLLVSVLLEKGDNDSY